MQVLNINTGMTSSLLNKISDNFNSLLQVFFLQITFEILTIIE